MPVIPAVRSLRKQDQKFKSNLGNRMTLSQKINNEIKKIILMMSIVLSCPQRINRDTLQACLSTSAALEPQAVSICQPGFPNRSLT